MKPYTTTKIDIEKVMYKIAEKNVKLSELSQNIGISERAFYFWLSGKTKKPYIKHVIKLSHFLGVEYNEIAMK